MAILRTASRRALKFLHTLGAVGFMGGIAALLIVVLVTPASVNRASYLPLIVAMARIAAWLISPAMVLTVVSGLLAMVANPAYFDAGWVWVKAATGILVLMGGLHVMGPIQEEAKRGASALAHSPDPTQVTSLFASEGATLWVLIGVSAANIALGIWRPRLPKTWP